MAVSKLSQIAFAGSAPALTDVVVGVQAPTGASPTDLLYTISQLGSSIPVVPSTTPISPSTNQAVLFDKAGVIGEDTNFAWDYTNERLNVAKVNAPGGAFTLFAGGTAVLDWGVTTANTLSVYGTSGLAQIDAAYFLCTGTTASQLGFYAYLNTDGSNRRIVIALDANNNPFVSFGPASGLVGDAGFYRDAVGVVGMIDPAGAGNPAGLRVYKTSDSVNSGTPPTSNFERGVFDWTISTNILTIGSQAGGTGLVRSLSFIGSKFSFTSSGSGNYALINLTGNSFLGFNGGTGFAEVLSVNLTNNKQYMLGDLDYIGNASATFIRYISQNGITALSAILGDGSANANFVIGDSNTVVSVNNVLGLSQSGDTGISRSAAGVVAFGNTAAGDASATFKAKTKAGAPTTSDVPAGAWILIRDTTNATTKMYYNNAGTLQTVSLV